jgi:hypothetical protein
LKYMLELLMSLKDSHLITQAHWAHWAPSFKTEGPLATHYHQPSNCGVMCLSWSQNVSVLW